VAFGSEDQGKGMIVSKAFTRSVIQKLT